MALWGKSDRTNGLFTPLFAHCLSVSEALGDLWRQQLAAGARALLGRLLEVDEATAGRWLAFLCGLHDLGKATPGFQGSCATPRAALTRLGLRFPAGAATDHTLTGLYCLRDLLHSWGLCDRREATALAGVLALHHGRPKPLPAVPPGARDLGDERWEALRLGLAGRLAASAGVALAQPPLGLRHPPPELLALLGGLVRMADWAASAPDSPSFGGRVDRASRSILRCSTGEASDNFATLFGFAPNALQAHVISLCHDLPAPSLVLIEAPTGEGKTEAALWVAQALEATGQRQGLFMAMPTRASAEAMRPRLQRLCGRGTVALAQAGDAHGPPSLALFAPVAVGTVDQALLGVLADRQSWVRLLGLANKTVIFDEVHAYEAYTSGLLTSLLRWLARLNCTVVLLSATLPQWQREELLSVFGAPTAVHDTYPRVTLCRADSATLHPYLSPASRTLTTEELPASDLSQRLRAALAEGGCAALVCNTVAAAQRWYLELEEALGPEGIAVSLLHARYPARERQRRVRHALQAYGKESRSRPQRSVLVATQLVEQSLDLDFDLLVSEWAPVDCLLQRAGRLHRHRRVRPARLSEPRLWLLAPEHTPEQPNFGPSAHVYHEYLLLRTWRALHGRGRLRLPQETDELIEAVYGAGDAASCPRLANLRRDLQRERDFSQALARQECLAAPSNGASLLPVAQTLSRHPRTHLSPTPEVSVVPVYGEGPGWYLDPGLTVALAPENPATGALLTAYAVPIRSARLQRARCGQRARTEERHGCRLLPVDERGEWHGEGLTLRFDAQLGAVLETSGGLSADAQL